jgi:LPS sulfotransferase NodH
MTVTPAAALVVCSSPRTGSGLLCSALWSTGLCGEPDEYLASETRRDYEAAWGTTGDRAYVEALLQRTTTPNGVFAMKVHWEHTPHTRWFAGSLDVSSDDVLGTLRALAPRVWFVRTSRRDRVRQAVSLYKRRVSRHKPPPTAAPSSGSSDHLTFDYDAIHRLVSELESYEMRWDECFSDAGIQPMRVCYEDDLEHGYVATVQAILDMMGIAVPAGLAVTSDFQKQADAVSDGFVRMYRAVDRARTGD